PGRPDREPQPGQDRAGCPVRGGRSRRAARAVFRRDRSSDHTRSGEPTATPDKAQAQAPARAVQRRPVTPYWQAVGAIAWKDLRAEIRSRELINSMVLFTLMTVMVFSLALELDSDARQNVVAGVLWVTVVFAGMLGFSRSLASEQDRGSLDALLLAPIDRSALFFGKMIGNLLFVLVIAFVLMLLLTVMFNVSL